MKNYLLISGVALIMSSCNQKELADTKQERDSLMAVVNDRDSFIDEFTTSFNDIENNLDAVAKKQNIISVNSEKGVELKMSQKSRINAEIASINNLMTENRKKIAELNKIVKNSSSKNVKLETMIATLNDRLTKKDVELTDLNTRLNELDAQVSVLETSVGTLTVENNMQEQTITDKNAALHTAYYVIGKSSELQDSKIIDRKGGLLGIGKTSKLSNDFDNSKFTRIDYTQTNNISVNSDIKIITSHPINSYTLVKDENDKDLVKNIVINDPEMFWSASKYLVVVKN